MAQYIDKDAVVAEIESLRCTSFTNFDEGVNATVQTLLEVLDTLEVEEVDLEKETKKWWKEHLHLNPENKLWMDAHQSVVFAKHFFELGLKAQKGE